MSNFISPDIDYSLLKDRSVIITGGASGLGYAVTQKFASHGAWVTIADISTENGETAVKELISQGYKATFVRCDTTDWTSLVGAFKHAIHFSPHRTLDVAALFAGVDGERASLVDLALKLGEPSLEVDPPQPPHKALDVNLTGVYLSTCLALHYFRLQPSGSSTNGHTNDLAYDEKADLSTPANKSLILVSSLAGYLDLPYNTGYNVSKFGVRGLFRTLRSQTPKINVRTNNIAPGYILTPLTKALHGIDSPDQPSKKTGMVLPWAPIEYLVNCACHLATNNKVSGRTFSVQPSGFIDIGEDADQGYGGEKLLCSIEQDGFMNIPSLFPDWKGMKKV